MPFIHKYQQHDFGNVFQTRNSILFTEHFKPEVIFIGTYNHSWTWNNSDFFYGRGMHMWTVLANLFLHNCNHLVKARSAINNIPTLPQLFELCEQGKIVFADIVKGLSDSFTAIVQPKTQTILANNQYIRASYKVGPVD